jgi:hypothetical protein
MLRLKYHRSDTEKIEEEGHEEERVSRLSISYPDRSCIESEEEQLKNAELQEHNACKIDRI